MTIAILELIFATVVGLIIYYKVIDNRAMPVSPPHVTCGEDLCVWPDDTYCTVDECESFMATVGLSDDFRIVDCESQEAMMLIDGITTYGE